jgi:hypothetical protein
MKDLNNDPHDALTGRIAARKFELQDPYDEAMRNPSRRSLPKPNFTPESVERACRKYHAEHGTHPKQNSGDCSLYFGWPRETDTWKNVDNSIRNGARGLEPLKGFTLVQFWCKTLGISTDKPIFTPESVEQACRKFYDEHGTHPGKDSGDCSPYFGWPGGTDTWGNVNKGIRRGARGLEPLKGFTLVQFCKTLGIAADKPDFTVEGLGQACRKYHAEHGTHPGKDSGDCSLYFGWPRETDTWENVNNGVRNGHRGLEPLKGSSLAQFCKTLGISTDKPDFAPESVERACRKYHAEHGTRPGKGNGDCSLYFGWPRETDTWENVDNCIRTGARGLEPLKGSSLFKMCKVWGLA